MLDADRESCSHFFVDLLLEIPIAYRMVDLCVSVVFAPKLVLSQDVLSCQRSLFW